MPFYNYECPKCGILELQRKMTMPEIRMCPMCNSKIQRVYSEVNDIWKCDGAFSKANHKE